MDDPVRKLSVPKLGLGHKLRGKVNGLLVRNGFLRGHGRCRVFRGLIGPVPGPAVQGDGIILPDVGPVAQGRAQGDAEGPLDVRLGLVCIHSQRINGELVRCI